jgi:hypothetical protein
MTPAAALLDTRTVDDAQASRRGRTRVLTLEIDADSDPIVGRLSERGAPGQPFVGWLGLARALELVLEPAEPAAGAGPPPARRGGRCAS